MEGQVLLPLQYFAPHFGYGDLLYMFLDSIPKAADVGPHPKALLRVQVQFPLQPVSLYYCLSILNVCTYVFLKLFLSEIFFHIFCICEAVPQCEPSDAPSAAVLSEIFSHIFRIHVAFPQCVPSDDPSVAVLHKIFSHIFGIRAAVPRCEPSDDASDYHGGQMFFCRYRIQKTFHVPLCASKVLVLFFSQHCLVFHCLYLGSNLNVCCYVDLKSALGESFSHIFGIRMAVPQCVQSDDAADFHSWQMSFCRYHIR